MVKAQATLNHQPNKTNSNGDPQSSPQAFAQSF
jgi:hypothetical protein